MAENTLRRGAIDVVSGRKAGIGLQLFRAIFNDPRFFWVAVIYGIGVSLLTLALPISVQVLIGAVANTEVLRSIVVLAIVLFVLLAMSGLLVGMQTYVLELFQRRFYGSMTREIALRTIYADTHQFERLNREQLANHYFEIDIIQKSIPSLLSNGLALVLQSLVGYIVVSFYHPVFLFFCVVHAFAVYLIWRQADRGAIRTAVELSKAKHVMANWLEALARNHRLFKSRRGIEHAVAETDRLTESYLAKHKRHFGFFFRQHIGFLSLYAVGSAVVLGVAGWLVIRGQLSLGQLVAAELILGAIFVGLSRFSYYLELYYAVCASADKLARFFDLELEDVSGDTRLQDWTPDIDIHDATLGFRGRAYTINAKFPAGSTTLIAPENSGIVRVFRDLIDFVRLPEKGQVLLGGHDMRDFDAHELRDEILIVADTQFFQTTVAEFLKIGDPEMTRARMRELLDVVGLKSVVQGLDGDLDAELNDNGMPLSTSEVLRLKIAQALASKPKLLLLLTPWDLLRAHRRIRILDYVNSQAGTTTIVFSNRRDIDRFNRYMYLGDDGSPVFDSLEELIEAEGSHRAIDPIVLANLEA